MLAMDASYLASNEIFSDTLRLSYAVRMPSRVVM